MKAKRTELFNELKREISQLEHNTIVKVDESDKGQLNDNILENIEEDKISYQLIISL